MLETINTKVKTAELDENQKPIYVEKPVTKEIPDTAEEMIKLYGAAVVRDKAFSQIKVDIQAGVRRAFLAGLDPQKWVAGYVPGVKSPSVKAAPMAVAMSAIGQMSDEERKELLAQLRKK